jgi:hypothetical protein
MAIGLEDTLLAFDLSLLILFIYLIINIFMLFSGGFGGGGAEGDHGGGGLGHGGGDGDHGRGGNPFRWLLNKRRQRKRSKAFQKQAKFTREIQDAVNRMEISRRTLQGFSRSIGVRINDMYKALKDPTVFRRLPVAQRKSINANRALLQGIYDNLVDDWNTLYSQINKIARLGPKLRAEAIRQLSRPI